MQFLQSFPMVGGGGGWRKQKGNDKVLSQGDVGLHLLDFMPGTLDIPPLHSVTEPPHLWGRLALHHGKCSLSGKTSLPEESRSNYGFCRARHASRGLLAGRASAVFNCEPPKNASYKL